MHCSEKLRNWGKQVVDIEKMALDNLYQYIDSDDFANACQTLLNSSGKVIVMGMGKSGHIGRKIAATFASTGTAAFFVHPGEAAHGDLGMLSSNDTILAISNSGESEELLMLLPVINRMGLTLIAMTSNPKSSLARDADIHLCIEVPEEACPLGLAPTSSTTATLVMGDALAVALLQANQFTANDFALSHPGGSLGRRLLIHVHDIMHKGDNLPVVEQSISIANALVEVSKKGLGMTAVVNKENQLCGIFTDGDLRRIIDANTDLRNTSIGEVMSKNCTSISENILASRALNIMEQKKINGLIITDEKQQPIGALNMLSLVKAGII